MIQLILLILCGLSAGLITAVAYVAFIAMLGIFPKIAAKTKTAKQCLLYENCLIVGVLFAIFLQSCVNYYSSSISQTALLPYPLGILLLIIFGLFGGIYVGFLIGGLSELLNVVPALSRKTGLQNRVHLFILFLALGKGTFSLLFLFS